MRGCVCVCIIGHLYVGTYWNLERLYFLYAWFLFKQFFLFQVVIEIYMLNSAQDCLHLPYITELEHESAQLYVCNVAFSLGYRPQDGTPDRPGYSPQDSPEMSPGLRPVSVVVSGGRNFGRI